MDTYRERKSESEREKERERICVCGKETRNMNFKKKIDWVNIVQQDCNEDFDEKAVSLEVLYNDRFVRNEEYSHYFLTNITNSRTKFTKNVPPFW